MPIQCLTKTEKQDFIDALDLALRSVGQEQSVLSENRERLSDVDHFLDISKDFAARISLLQKMVRDSPECPIGGTPTG